MQLTEIQNQFPAMGINVAAVTYDPYEFLKEVELDEGIEFTLLQDVEMRHVNAFGILNNTDYEPGDRAWGVPYPGIFLIDADGIIRFKLAEEGYRIRPDFADVLEAAASMQ
ncbi:MAG: peroxiredoxin family protein [Gammaproteobacteria bacterium]|nr:peroxiredoxin family protein [Gammaproteobacteria bacterium]